jgi:hypothetical protein
MANIYFYFHQAKVKLYSAGWAARFINRRRFCNERGNDYETICNCRDRIFDTCFNSTSAKTNLSGEGNAK